MFIKQFTYSRDNLGYLVFSKNEGIVIDGGAVNPICEFALKNKIKIRYVTNTHSHHDHVCGNRAMLDQTGAEFIDCKKVFSDQKIKLDDQYLEILATPGHTDDSITFIANGFMVTGDTLFNGTIGNCFSGDLDAFFNSLSILMKNPGHTKIYAGHDYVMDSMKMATIIEPANPDIELYIQSYDPRLVVSKLQDELRVNPYIRFNTPEMIKLLKQKNLPCQTPAERFKSIMEIY